MVVSRRIISPLADALAPLSHALTDAQRALQGDEGHAIEAGPTARPAHRAQLRSTHLEALAYQVKRTAQSMERGAPNGSAVHRAQPSPYEMPVPFTW